MARRDRALWDYTVVLASAIRDVGRKPVPPFSGDRDRPIVRPRAIDDRPQFFKYCGVGTGAANVSDVGLLDSVRGMTNQLGDVVVVVAPCDLKQKEDLVFRKTSNELLSGLLTLMTWAPTGCIPQNWKCS